MYKDNDINKFTKVVVVLKTFVRDLPENLKTEKEIDEYKNNNYLKFELEYNNLKLILEEENIISDIFRFLKEYTYYQSNNIYNTASSKGYILNEFNCTNILY